MADVAKLAQDVKSLSASDKNNLLMEVFKGFNLLELTQFRDLWCDTFKVSAAAPVAVAAGPAAAAAPAEKPAEATEFNVIITGCGDKKISVIKAVREITNLGLKEAKDLVDALPKPIKEKVSKEDAAKLKQQLEASGATVEIKSA